MPIILKLSTKNANTGITPSDAHTVGSKYHLITGKFMNLFLESLNISVSNIIPDNAPKLSKNHIS